MKPLLTSIRQLIDKYHLRPTRTQWIRFGVSLLLAVLFWGWVTELQDPLTEKTITGVPIAIGVLPDSLQVVTTLANATVRIEGAQSRIRSVSQADITLAVDLTDIDEPGEYRRTLVATAPDIDDVSVEPNEVTIEVEERVSENFPVNTAIANPTDQTRTISDVRPDVTEVTVSGPSSAVERVADVILPVSFDQQIDNFEESYTPYAIDSDGQRVSEVSILPGMILTEVDLQTSGKSVSVIPMVTGVPAEGFSVQQRRALPDTIIVDGPAELIDDLLFVNTEPVDVTDATQSISTRVELADLPEGVTIIEPAGDTIEVRLAIEDISASSQPLANLPVEPVGLGDGLSAVIAQTTISIQVSAPIDILQAMTPEDISIWVNLSGLAPGIYDVPLEVTVPQGATWQTSESLVTSVTIEESLPASPVAIPAPPASPAP